MELARDFFALIGIVVTFCVLGAVLYGLCDTSSINEALDVNGGCDADPR
jgi:hypothetical protein